MEPVILHSQYSRIPSSHSSLVKISPANLNAEYQLGCYEIQFEEDSGIISSFQTRTGFFNRQIINCISAVPAQMSINYFQRIEPMSGMFYAAAAAMAIESTVSLDVPERAIRIRMILMELQRILSHLNYLEVIALNLGHFPTRNYLLREKEKIFDVFEVFCGSRPGFGAICLGGVISDATDGWLFRIEKATNGIRASLLELEDVLTSNPIFIKRMKNLLPISPSDALTYGISGPNARACGLDIDLRRTDAKLHYAKFMNFLGPVSHFYVGDGLGRVVARIADITESLDLIQRLSSEIPRGNFLVRVGNGFSLVEGGGSTRLESPRGHIQVDVKSGDSHKILSTGIKNSSQSLMNALPQIFPGTLLEDLFLALASLDLSIAEVDLQ